MKTKTLSIIFLLFTLVSCNGGGGGSSSGASINPASAGVWDRYYTESGTPIREMVSIVGRVAVIQIRHSGTMALIQEITWVMTPIDSDTVSVNDGTDVFNADYTVDGTTLEVCPEASACMEYTKVP